MLTPFGQGSSTIKVFGIGRFGTRIVASAFSERPKRADLFCMDTDRAVLDSCRGLIPLLLGGDSFKGRGTRGDPREGEQAIRESIHAVGQALAGARAAICVCGLGGGTGTGAIPLVIDQARSAGAWVGAIVAMPFPFESTRRQVLAQEAAQRIATRVDAVITLRPDREYGLDSGAIQLEAARLEHIQEHLRIMLDIAVRFCDSSDASKVATARAA